MKNAFFALFLVSAAANASPITLKCQSLLRNPGPNDFKSLTITLSGDKANLKFDGAKAQDNTLNPSGEQVTLKLSRDPMEDDAWLVFHGDEVFGQDDFVVNEHDIRSFGLTMQKSDLESGESFKAHLTFTKIGPEPDQDFMSELSCSR